MGFWKQPAFVSVILGFLGLSSALLELFPFPDELRECYEFRSYNMTPSDQDALQIQTYCYRHYQYKQLAKGSTWPSPNITQEGMNYIQGLFRQIFNEAREVQKSHQNSKRHKRQAFFPWRYRQEVRSPGAYQRYVNCILRLQTESVEPPFANRNTYQTLSVLHSGEVLPYAHNGPAFIPWHRIYLLLLETACGVPVPYWDSTVDHDMADPTMSIVWSDIFFGNGDGDVMTGPFQSIRTILGPLVRNIATGPSALFTKQGLQDVLSRQRYSEIVEPTAEEEYNLEGHHNGPHRWVGGHLSMLNTAAYDPIFFNHHAFIDHVYELFRQQQIRLGINPEVDYPPVTPNGHAANDMIDFRPYARPLRNIEGLSNFIASLVRYEPLPSCMNQCNRSPFLFCDQARFVCVSRPRATTMMPGGGAQGFDFTSQPGQVPASQNVPSVSRMRAQARGPIPGGPQFGPAPITDSRNRPDTIGSAPAAPQVIAASIQARGGGGAGRRRREAVTIPVYQNSSSVDENPQMSSLQRSFTNTFVMDGVVDLKRWVYVSVRIVYNRSFNKEGKDPTFHANSPSDVSKDVCHGVESGATKVYVTSHGLNYDGIYTEFAIVDERQPVSITTAAVGIKNPDYGDGETLFTAYDSCKRPCRPLCLASVQGKQKYKPCSAVFKVSSASPKMFHLSYRDALTGDWQTENMIDSFDMETPQITFVCENSKFWPWEY